ncbi:MAG: cation transporter [Rhodospirillales bacterium]
MDARQTATERRYLLITAYASLAIGCVGVAFSFVAESQAILLDALYNLVYFIAGLFTLKVARLVQRGDDQDFPYGYSAFESLVNGLKGILVMGVTLFAFVDGVATLLSGGRTIDAGPAVIYGALAATACWTLAVLTRRAATRSGSPLVRADAQNWLVNAAVSTGVLLAFVGVFAIQGTALEFLSPYVDSTLVILVVLFSISVPLRMSWQSLMELMVRAPQADIVAQVRGVVEAATAELPVDQLFLRVTQFGRTRLVLVHVVLPRDHQVGPLAALDCLRAETQAQLKTHHPNTVVDMLFTTDPAMGAPLKPVSGG